MKALPLLVNVLSTQGTWFASVIGASHGQGWIGPVAAVGTVALHAPVVAWPRWRLGLFVAALAMGAFADTALIWTGLITYAGAPSLAPPWILALWINLAVMLGGCLAWLRKMPWGLIALIGAISGPAAYLGGESLGALSFPGGRIAGLLALALIWSICLPLLSRIEPAPEPAHA